MEERSLLIIHIPLIYFSFISSNDSDSIGIRDSFNPHISTLQTLPVDDDINDSTLTNGLNGGEEIYVDEDEIVDEDDEEEDEPIDRQRYIMIYVYMTICIIYYSFNGLWYLVSRIPDAV